jgi:hypothetical protein
MANGIKVWLDEWDIEPGESLRQQMEKGLEDMTHFVVILTPAALRKPWVAMEVDAGIIRKIEGDSRFIPLLVGVALAELPVFLRTILGIRFDPSDQGQLTALVDQIHGVSRKPALGSAPDYVKPAPPRLSGWSPASIEVGRYLISESENAMPRDPLRTLEELIAGTGLAEKDIRIAVLDLKDAGYLWQDSLSGHYAPLAPMFIDFDEACMLFSPELDAAALACRMMAGATHVFETKMLATDLGWEPRRINSAICYLQRAGIILDRTALASAPWRAVQLVRTDATLRFARSLT